jgi:hypothetical protein
LKNIRFVIYGRWKVIVFCMYYSVVLGMYHRAESQILKRSVFLVSVVWGVRVNVCQLKLIFVKLDLLECL